jgi:hypothetical protein
MARRITSSAQFDYDFKDPGTYEIAVQKRPNLARKNTPEIPQAVTATPPMAEARA